MKSKLTALVLALTVMSWAQTTTQTAPAAPEQGNASSEKGACPCCDKKASAEAKAENSCCGHHAAANKDGKDPACCHGKDKGSCCDAKSCVRGKDKTLAACNSEKCGKDCKDCTKSCRTSCKKADKTAMNDNTGQRSSVDPASRPFVSVGK